MISIRQIYAICLALTLSLFLHPFDVKAINAVASVKSKIGEVNIQRSDRHIPGREGLVLNDKDIVVTGQQSRVTLLFRDGSEIRLFQNTRFVIEKSEEMDGKYRGFLNNFRLKAGAFWGRFTQGRQKTLIATPTATCGIKGTSVAIQERRGEMNVSLSSGAVEITNDDEKLTLQAGKMIEGIKEKGSFKEKIKDMPFRLSLTPDNSKIDIPTEGNIGKINFTVQVLNVKTNQNVDRVGEVVFSFRSDKLEFPERVALNERGFARFTVRVMPFEEPDYKDGRIEILAIVDGENNLDTGTGQTTLTYDVPQKYQKVFHIDAGSGKVN